MEKISLELQKFLFLKRFNNIEKYNRKDPISDNEEYFELVLPAGLGSQQMVDLVQQYFLEQGLKTNKEGGTIEVFNGNNHLYKLSVTGFNINLPPAMLGGTTGCLYVSIFHTAPDSMEPKKDLMK